MKLPCKVVEDLLPLHYDGVCSQESKELVKAHLNDCPQCSRVLKDLQFEANRSEIAGEDLGLLKRIASEWKKSKRSSLKKGICITLAALLLVTAVLVSVWYFSYAKYYFQMADKMEPTPDHDDYFTSSHYCVESDGYRYELWLPIVLSDCGFARVMDDNGMVMFIYPGVGGDVDVSVVLTYGSGSFIKVWLNSDLTPNYEDHKVPVRTDSEKELILDLLDEKRNEIIDMLDAIHKQWGIQYLN